MSEMEKLHKFITEVNIHELNKELNDEFNKLSGNFFENIEERLRLNVVESLIGSFKQYSENINNVRTSHLGIVKD